MKSRKSTVGANVLAQTSPSNARGLSEEEIRDQYLEHAVAESAASEIMNTVVDNATELMISNHFDRLSIPYTVCCVSKEILDFVNCAFVGQDTGFVRPPGWHADPMAEEIMVDTWARSAVGVRQARDKTPTLSVTLPGHDGHRGKRSARSEAKGENDTPPKGSNSNKLGANPLGGRSGRNRLSTSSVSSQMRSSSRSGNATTEGSVAGDLDDPEMTMLPEEIEYMQKVEEEASQRDARRAASERISKEMEELSQKKDTKGLVVDATSGKVMAVKGLDRASHQKKMEVRYNFDDSPRESNAPVGKSPRGTNGRAPSESPVRGGGKKSKNNMQEFFHEDAAAGPMVTAVMPSGGVAVKETAGMKRAELKVPKTKVSRQDFHRMVDATNASNEIDSVPGDGSVSSRQKAEIVPTPKRDSGPAQLQPIPQAPQQVPPTIENTSIRRDFRSQGTSILPNRSMGPSVHHTHANVVPSPQKKPLAVPPLPKKLPKTGVHVHQNLVDDLVD